MSQGGKCGKSWSSFELKRFPLNSLYLLQVYTVGSTIYWYKDITVNSLAAIILKLK